MRRWVLPIGLVGLLPLATIGILLEGETAKRVFGIARLVFVFLYVALLAFGMGTTRRMVRIRLTRDGLYEGDRKLVAFSDVTRILDVTKSTGPELRVETVRDSFGLVPSSRKEARELEAAFAEARGDAPVTFLAKTTPERIAALSWLGPPLFVSPIAQFLLMADAIPEPVVLAGLVAAFIALWLGTTWHFSRRRRLTMRRDGFLFPSILGREELIPYERVEYLHVVDPLRLELKFQGRRSRTILIYEPDDLVGLVHVLKDHGVAQRG